MGYDPEMATLAARWNTLPDHIKAAVRALLVITPSFGPPAPTLSDDSLPPGFEGAKGETG
jgi:hypothetical protein